jgi:hypothetical protein
MKKFNVTQAKSVPGRDKAVWIRHGIAFENDSGKIRVKLESIPIPDEKGEIWLSLFEDNGEQSARSSKPAQQASDDDFGDDIPF